MEIGFSRDKLNQSINLHIVSFERGSMIERSRNIRRRSIFVHLGKSFTRIWYALPLSLYMALTIWCPKSTFYGNRAACYSSLHSYELVIADCSSSIHLNMNYTKVIVRRAQAYEALEKYDEALTGYSSRSILLSSKRWVKTIPFALAPLEILYAAQYLSFLRLKNRPFYHSR